MPAPPGFATLNGIPFRLNPSSIQWGFSIDTNVEETIGGRVVQVLGATLTDITVSGEYGEKKGYVDTAKSRTRDLYPGKGALLSWELAEAFLERVRVMMDKQSEDSTEQGLRGKILDFRFPEYGWHFGVFVKAIDNGQGAPAINHTVGAIAYKYSLTLFVVEDRSDDLVLASGKGTALSKAKTAAVEGYISRISRGVGWKLSRFNEPYLVQGATKGTVRRANKDEIENKSYLGGTDVSAALDAP